MSHQIRMTFSHQGVTLATGLLDVPEGASTSTIESLLSTIRSRSGSSYVNYVSIEASLVQNAPGTLTTQQQLDAANEEIVKLTTKNQELSDEVAKSKEAPAPAPKKKDAPKAKKESSKPAPKKAPAKSAKRK